MGYYQPSSCKADGSLIEFGAAAAKCFGAVASLVRRASANTGGGLLVTFALVFPMMLLLIGSAIDFGYMYARRTALQGATDAAALSSTRELVLANADEKAIHAIVQASVIGNLGDDSSGVQVKTEVNFDDRSVTVAATQSPGLFLMDGLLGIKDFSISAHSIARVAGDMPICMLILEISKQGAIAVNKSARLTGNKCAIYSNSVSASGIITKGDSHLESDLTCSAGGFLGEPYTYKPVPLTDCPPIEDPLASREPPPVGPCLETDLTVASGSHTLKPGTYCGGLTIQQTADVTLSPGIYVIKDGVLQIGGSAHLRGENVGFYISGSKANFNMLPNTSIELSAPKDGPMAGILFFEDRNNPMGRRNVIRSNDARSFVGTIYLSQGALVVDASKPLFDESAYTVVIARFLDMFSGPNLVLNSNYGDTDVPLPSELSRANSPGQEVVLAE